MKVEDVVLHCSGMLNGTTSICIMREQNGKERELLAVGGKYDTQVTAYYGDEVSKIFCYPEINGVAIWITQ